MVSPARIAANRLNARRSTGPRTPGGKARASLNAARHGLYAQVALLPALGEAAADWDAFRGAVTASLSPAGAAEGAIAGRVAFLLWRQRRAAAYAPAAGPDGLPSDPDTVTGEGIDADLPVHPAAPPEYLLGRCRVLLRWSRNTLASRRAGAVALAGADVELEQIDALDATNAVGLLLGWKPFDRPDPWAGVLADLGVEVDHRWDAPWTAELLRRAVARAGEAHGRDPVIFEAEATAAVAETVARSVMAIAAREAEEVTLVAGMRAARAAAVAAAVVDDPRTERVARQEAHLSRELDRVIAQLERLRGLRPMTPARGGDGGPVDFGV
jgi:hypothetical protein